ncbi:MAG: hypothetical protein V4819_05135 [Verrucomicrobiota bacterium]
MDPINPWLDPLEVRRLAERLMKPNREPAVTAPDAGFDDAFVGFANDPIPQQSAPPPLPAPPVREEPLALVVPPSGGLRPPPPASEEPAPPLDSPFQAPAEIQTTARGPFLDRITRFRDWLHDSFSATGIFILDREGAVIFDESSHGRLHFLARSLALASRRPGASAGNVHVKIGAGATLEVIPVDTTYGCLVLGAVVPEALDPPAVLAVMEALALVAARPVEG